MQSSNSTKMHELLHQLQTLEADLVETNKLNLISEIDFNSRFERLQRASKHSAKLRGMISAKATMVGPPSHVDLPVMADYSRMEQKIVSKYIEETKNFINDLVKVLQTVSLWSQDAANHSTNWMVAIWRLSWIRKQMRRITGDSSNVKNARGVVENFIAKATNEPWNDSNKNGQKVLESVFYEFEAANARVTALKAKLKGEIAKNEHMRTWLEKYSENRRTINPEQVPPDPKAVSEVVKPVTETLLNGAAAASERLVIARQLANAVCPVENSQAQESAMRSTLNKSNGTKIKVGKKRLNQQVGG